MEHNISAGHFGPEERGGGEGGMRCFQRHFPDTSNQGKEGGTVEEGVEEGLG